MSIILCIIQARMGSTRLPGKVLMQIGGKAILQWVIEAAEKARLVDRVIVATTAERKDDVIGDRYEAFRYGGNPSDVLGRFYHTALHYSPTHIVRLTSDCPASDPEIIDAVIRHHLRGNYDYTTNSGFPGSYPDGQDVEVFTMGALTRAAKLATQDYDREHVTPFMKNSDMFKVGKLYCANPTGKKLSVDTREDYERIKEELECSLNRRSS